MEKHRTILDADFDEALDSVLAEIESPNKVSDVTAKMLRLAEEIVNVVGADYGVQVTVRKTAGNRTHCKVKRDADPVIWFGAKNTEYYVQNGFCDYPEVSEWVWQGKVFFGPLAVWAIALHEVAHAITWKRQWGARPHGFEFQDTLRELADRYIDYPVWA